MWTVIMAKYLSQFSIVICMDMSKFHSAASTQGRNGNGEEIWGAVHCFQQTKVFWSFGLSTETLTIAILGHMREQICIFMMAYLPWPKSWFVAKKKSVTSLISFPTFNLMPNNLLSENIPDGQKNGNNCTPHAITSIIHVLSVFAPQSCLCS